MDVQKMFREACGTRTMDQFREDMAADYDISTPSLYRIASGRVKTPVKAELLAAVEKHRAPESTVTAEDLQKAFDEILSEQPKTVRTRRTKTEIVGSMAETFIANSLLSSGLKVQREELRENAGDFDFSYTVENDSSTKKKLLFDIHVTEMRKTTVHDIDRFVGKVLRTGKRDADIWHYLVLVDDTVEKGVVSKNLKSAFCDTDTQAEGYGKDLPVNIGVLVVSQTKDRYHVDEFLFGPGKPIVTFAIDEAI